MSKVDSLTKGKNGRQEEPSVVFEKFKNHKIKVKKMCKGLTTSVNHYKPEWTCDTIENMQKEKELDNRILYSEVSNYLFNLSDENRGVFATNLEKLLFYVFDEKSDVKESCKKVVVKIYDHFNLVTNQISAIERARLSAMETSLEVSKADIEKSLKKIEREYITILGIFASIVLAFVGNLAFSTSVLENIDKASIYRVLMVVCLIGMIFVNIIYLLLKFIEAFHKNDVKISVSIWKLNLPLFIFMGIVAFGWLVDITIFQGRFSYWIHSLI